MGLFVKICGCANEADAKAVASFGPDAMGFIFWPGSPRCVDPAEVSRWVEGMPAAILKVGVFVNQELDVVRDTAATAGLDVVQLHGDETPAYCGELEGRIWKAVHLDRCDLALLNSYPVDAFLVDSYSTESPGGTGKTVDWSVAADFVRNSPKNVLLAGGLRPENVGEAVDMVHPWGVDVSSGVEASPGRKDLEKVREFIEACRMV
ncbi:MAG: phosphoribosylanthranilate isomerase [Verrucomicrobia bacterium]|nr:phosphoribosylanthranilate isomerase [Verrucomicrobiota bacterium]